jgi:hypothetical protein
MSSEWQRFVVLLLSLNAIWLPRQGANTQLRGRVQDLASELQEVREQLAALDGLQQQMAAHAPEGVDVDALVKATVAHERASQEARNRKVLELLKSKVGAMFPD